MNRRTVQPALVLLATLVVLAAIAVVLAVPPADEGNPSSRSAGKLGTLAMYSWLDRLGLPVSRVSGTFSLAGADVLVEYDPTVELTSADVDAVMAHLLRGGDLLLAIGPANVGAAAPLLQRLQLVPAAVTQTGVAVPAQPFDIGDRVHRVPVTGGVAFLDAPPLVPLLVQERAVVAGVVRGRSGGRAYVIGNTQPLSNDGLRHDDSASFLLTLLERARGGRIAFDEFHHGEISGANDGAGAIVLGPVGLAALLLGLLVVVFLAVNGRRLGRAVTVESTAVPSAASYVEAVGHLLSRSRQRGGVAARYGDELKRRIGALTGTDAASDDAAFVTALAAAGFERSGDVHMLLARARRLQASRPDEASLLRLARDVDALEREWAQSPAPAQWRS